MDLVQKKGSQLISSISVYRIILDAKPENPYEMIGNGPEFRIKTQLLKLGSSPLALCEIGNGRMTTRQTQDSHPMFEWEIDEILEITA